MTLAALTHRRAIIVGSGHAGLSVASELSRMGLVPQRDFAVIDSNCDGRRSWGYRWSSMTLLTEAGRSPIAGRHLSGDPYRHPSPREVEEHLLSVESSLRITTMWGVRATGVQRLGDGSTLLLSTNEGQVQTRNIVCASGSAGRPRIPSWAVETQAPGIVLHSADYRGPTQIPAGDVLIIGAGHSGQQVARELSSSHRVTLSSRSPQGHSPGAGRGRWMGRQLRDGRASHSPNWEALGVTLMPAAVAVDGAHIIFEDGQRTAPQSVIFATGYLPADTWLPTEVRDSPRGRGTTAVPGLFIAGMPLYSKPDADTFDGARRDAMLIARRIMKRP